MTETSDAAVTFDPLRPKLLRVAYRMLGSVADAEDIVQEAFLRWFHADRAVVLEPEAFLRRVVARLCLDQLKSARRRRETYVGPWLPEPVVEAEEDEIDDVTLPLMMALERLSPLEQAAFLLHDVFGIGFDEIAETINREPAACRQLASRARTHVRTDRPRFPLPKERSLKIAEAFFAASRDRLCRWRRQGAGGNKTNCRVRRCDAVLCLAGPSVCQTDVAPIALRLHQRLARIRHDRAGRYLANHGVADRGRQGCRGLCHAQSRQAPAPQRSNHSVVFPGVP